MPKYGIHHIVLEAAIERLGSSASRTAREAAALLEEERFTAGLGAIGPDLFFFADDYSVIAAINVLMPVLEFYESVAGSVEAMLKPVTEIEEAIGDKVDETLDSLGLGVITRIRERIDAIEQLLDALERASIQAGVLQGINPLQSATTEDGEATSPFTRIVRELYENFLIPPLQNNYEEPDWYWFDMLHYRQVGDFARNLMRAADTDQKKAYALGYLTHIGTDLVGHPYVNQISGGPFRLGVQRHVTAEGFMDAHAYQQEVGRAVHVSLARDLGMDEDNHPEMEEDLAEFIEEALRETYARVVHPLLYDGQGFPDAEQIRDAYKLLRRAINSIGAADDLRPEPPVGSADEDLSDVMAAVNGLNPPPAPPPPPAGAPDFRFDQLFDEGGWAGLVAALEAAGQSVASFVESWVGYAAETAQWALETAVQLLRIARELVETAANSTGRPLLVLLYGIQLALYDLLQRCRWILAINGLVYPDPDMIGDDVSRGMMFLFDPERHLLYAPRADAAKQPRHFPRLRAKGQSHLIAPRYVDECALTIAAFHGPGEDGTPVTPASFMHDRPFDERALRAYAGAADPAASQALRDSGREIGNAVELCAWMIEQSFSRPDRRTEATLYANWNLDGDRGYGAKSWAARLPHNWDVSPVAQLSIALHADGGNASMAALFEPDGTISFANSIHGIQSTCRLNDDDSDDTIAKIKAKEERHAESRTTSDLRVANLTLAEGNIPPAFSGYQSRDPDLWRAILAPRLRLSDDSYRRNLFHINGVGTPAYDAFYERYHVEHYLRKDTHDKIRVRLLYNFTDSQLPIRFTGTNRLLQESEFEDEISSVGDAVQAMDDKLWSYRAMARVFSAASLNDLANKLAGAPLTMQAPPLPEINNATTIAVISLLHEAFGQDRPLGLLGYSHGTQIIFNAIAAFAFQGDPEREFLEDKVRVLFFGRMVDTNSLSLLRRIVNDFVQLANPGDPIADILGNLPPDLAFLDAVSRVDVGISLTNPTLRSGLIDFLTAIDAEQHKFYLYAPRLKNDVPDHQSFF